VEWKDYGETEKLTKPVYLKNEVDARSDIPSIFSFFLDGSRHTYKVDDMSFNKNVYPILAGQVGVGCCERRNRKLSCALPFERKLVIVLPDKSFSNDGWDIIGPKDNLLLQINKKSFFNTISASFNNILIYDTNKDDKYDKKGVAKIQDYMVELEKQMVADLVAAGKLNQDNYLIKDGSLDYQKISKVKNKNALTPLSAIYPSNPLKQWVFDFILVTTNQFLPIYQSF
jgi:hypothetical protein